ncbi:MAG: hypothetical protein HQ402_01235 [Parcubacteria group bacterium]|nr:hypothetical protein [Parcubacteria group bacterium]
MANKACAMILRLDLVEKDLREKSEKTVIRNKKPRKKKTVDIIYPSLIVSPNQ